MKGAESHSPFHLVKRVRGFWSALSLVRQFMLLSTILVLLALSVLGYWVASKIEEGIKLDVSTRAALYMENFVSPHLQELSHNSELSQSSIEKIELALSRDARSLNVNETKIWNLEGKVLYGSDKSIIGKSFPLTQELEDAAKGQIEIGFDEEAHLDHSKPDAIINEALLEIYVPISDSETKKIIAIAEFYQGATVVKNAIALARLQSWGVTGLVSLGLIAGLYKVVARGSQLIEQQRQALDQRIHDLTELLDQNSELHNRIRRASQRANEDLEIQMRRIGTDLHDGIGQILTIVMLKLDRVFTTKKSRNADYEAVRFMLDDAMTELRDMSVGLALPEIEKFSLREAVKLIALRHERRTGTQVTLDLDTNSTMPTNPIKLCLCRFVQEGLNNAFKHAGGVQQKVASRICDGTITLMVTDGGPGISTSKTNRKHHAMGLNGLRNRLESLGGKLTIQSDKAHGTTLIATLAINAEWGQL